jgi:hypothetical protein
MATDTSPIDLRQRITLGQGGSNALFIFCKYKGKERTFFQMNEGRKSLISVVSFSGEIEKGTLGIKLDSVYDNYRLRLVPSHLSYIRLTEAELIKLNGGREIYGVV